MWSGPRAGWCLPLTFVAAVASAQAPDRSVATAAVADASSTETGGFLLAIPGVDDDFVLFADGQFVERSNGTARFSAYLHRLAAIDREFFVELEFTGRVTPVDPGYPPAGSPVTTLQSSAYVPAGPVDPATFVYYTSVTGTLTGLRGFEGARLSATNVGAAQIGAGASNKNVGPGLALDLALLVVQQPTYGMLAPAAPAQLRCDLGDSLVHCATHVDADPTVSNGPARAALTLPGIGDDYVFLPAARWLEAADGTATLQGTVRRESDFDDVWLCDLSFSGRVDPGDPAWPPPGSPVQQLLPGAYSSLGGPIDPDDWRYYTTVAGTLQGDGLQHGGEIQLDATGAFQVGLGADQGNRFFGLWGQLAPTVVAQPPANTISPTGDATLQADLGTSCILPPPQVLTGINQAIPSVTEQKLVYTGVDLGWVEQAALGPIVLGLGNPRAWFDGTLTVIDASTVELGIPQGLAPAPYPLRLLNATTLSNPLVVDIQAPATPVLRTEDDRLTGEPQHWVVHQGSIVGFAFSFVCLSDSLLPSSAPGIANFAIGNQFTSFSVIGGAVHDPVTGVAVVTLPAVPPWIAGYDLYAQAAILDAAFFPATPSDTWLTQY